MNDGAQRADNCHDDKTAHDAVTDWLLTLRAGCISPASLAILCQCARVTLDAPDVVLMWFVHAPIVSQRRSVVNGTIVLEL